MSEIEAICINSGMVPFVKKLIEISKQNENCDLYKLIHLVYFDIVGMIEFGKYFNAINTPNHDIVKWLKDSLVYSLMTYSFPITKYFGNYFGKQGYNAILELCKKLIQEAKDDKSGNSHPDVLHVLLESKDPVTGESISDSDIQAEMVTQVVAAIDTTTVTIIWAIKTLLKNPDMMKRIVSELDAGFPIAECNITADAIKKKCPNLKAFLFETLRVFLPVASFTPRFIPKEGAIFSGYHLAPGMECSYASFTYHHTPLYWDDPEVFNPKRFMGPEGFKLRSKVLVFLLGPTGCAVRDLSWLGLFLTTANLLRNFNTSMDNLNLSFEHTCYMVTKPIIDSLPVKVSIRNNQ